MEEQQAEIVRRERLVAFLFVLAGLAVLALSLREIPVADFSPRQLLLASLFAGAVILADQFPIHLIRGTKVSMTSVPIYLSAIFLPIPLAILTAGTSTLIADIRARAERGLLPRDIASNAGQWMLACFFGSLVADLNMPWFSEHLAGFIALVFGALMFLVVDFVCFAFSMSFVLKEPFSHILKSTLTEGFSVEVSQYLIAILGALVASEEIWYLILLIVPGILVFTAFKNIKEVRHETLGMLEDMADTVDLRDVYTGGHSKRVVDLVHQTLVQMRIFGPEATLIEISARLHDIGKLGIPDEVLKKPGKLLPEEAALMQTNAAKGAELISKYNDFSRGAMMIKHHHERWDGQGYPGRLEGYEIPFGARVIAVADSFDAMTSDRPYRKALSSYQAAQILLEGRGKQWDPNIVNAFVDLMIDQKEGGIQERLSQQQVSLALSHVLNAESLPNI